MTDFTRYAVYYAPREGDLASFGAAWLGWDARSGSPVAHPDIAGLPRPVTDLTESARKYGFHATLKPPFRLAPETSHVALERDLAELARVMAPVELDGLEVARLGGFVALVAKGETDALLRLAARVVERLDTHRAEMGADELNRRDSHRLSPRQRQNLMRWGYAHVMQDFRFHMTLTGRLPRGEADQVLRSLGPVLAPLLPEPFVVDALCLFGESRDGRFHLIRRHALCGATGPA